MNLLIHDIAAAIEREAYVSAPPRERHGVVRDHLAPWEQAPASGSDAAGDEELGPKSHAE